jgi:colanic acid/amylovoran biosynthesis protein
MLRTAAMEVQERMPGAQLLLPMDCGTVEQRRALGADDVIWLHHHRIPGVKALHNRLAAHWASGASVDWELMPARRPRRPGISPFHWMSTARAARSARSVAADQVDAILDLSGFGYGDPWGAKDIELRADYYRHVRSRGGKVILLPQQLGPFEKDRVRTAFRNLYDFTDLVFARDPRSYSAAAGVVGEAAKLRIVPDFTVRHMAAGPIHPELSGRSCIVPNSRMLDKTDAATAAAYETFLLSALDVLIEAGTRPFLLIHDATGDDLQIADRLRVKHPGLEAVTDRDPFVLKQILGQALLVVGSRFHALVGALSQGVPVLAVGWSHKYPALLEDYGCPHFLLDPRIPPSELQLQVQRLLGSRAAVSASLLEREADRVRRVDSMWREICALLGVEGPQERDI